MFLWNCLFLWIGILKWPPKGLIYDPWAHSYLIYVHLYLKQFLLIDMCFLSHKDFHSAPWESGELTHDPLLTDEKPQAWMWRDVLHMTQQWSHGSQATWLPTQSPAKWGEGSTVTRQGLSETVTFPSSLRSEGAVPWGHPWEPHCPSVPSPICHKDSPSCLYSFISWERIWIWLLKGPEESMGLEAKADAFCPTQLCP